MSDHDIEHHLRHGNGQASVACATCRKDVPASAARTFEGEDYVVYFCGIDCYDRWRQRRNDSPDRP